MPKQKNAPPCRWCGKSLYHEHTSHNPDTGKWEPDKRWPMYDRPGYSGNGVFCTLRCAARRAIRDHGGAANF